MPRSRFKYRAKSIPNLFTSLFISLILGLLTIYLWPIAPSYSQNMAISSAPVVIDGVPLFYLRAGDKLAAEERSRTVNKLLEDTIASGQPLNLAIRDDAITGATAITLNRNYLLTITANDIFPDADVNQRASQWQQILEQAIARARWERSPDYLWQRGIWIAIAIGVMIGLYMLRIIATRLFKQLLRQPTYTLSNIGLGAGWVAIAIVGSEWFPLIRSWRYQFLSPLLQPEWLAFFAAVTFAWVISYYAVNLLQFVVSKIMPQTAASLYSHVIQPSDRLVQMSVLSIALNWSLSLLEPLQPIVHSLLRPISSLFLVVSVSWLCIKLTSRYLRTYGFKLGGNFSTSSDDAILVFETIFNVLIFIVALVAFARSLNFDLIGLVASLGLVGLAVAFAAQKILEQLIATLVIYLDRPFISGDYIRLPGGELGKVESIGLRSTKIRSLGTGTIIIMPNSILVSVEIENVTLAKKIMVLLYMDFASTLGEREYALVQQVIMEKTATLSGIDANSTNISSADDSGKRLRVSFAILGSQDNAIEVRKRLLELASVEVAKSLSQQGIVFTMEDPTIYVQSPVTI